MRRPTATADLRVLVHFRGSVLEDRGTPLRCRNLAVWLSRRSGTDVTLMSRDASPKVQRLLRLSHVPIDSLATALPTLRRALDDVRPDVVYTQTHKGAFDLARLTGERSPALVADLHGDPAWEKLEDEVRPWPRRVKGFLSSRFGEWRSFSHLDGFTAVSEALLARVERWGKPAELLLGGVDPDVFRAPEPLPGRFITVGYAGSFSSYHGIDDLLIAAEQLIAAGRPFRFLLMGDIDRVPGMRGRVERRLGNRQTILGPVPYGRIPGLLGRCDVLVVPRRRGRAAERNYPSKLSEYLALGRAVLVTDVGQAGSVVRLGETALLAPSGDPSALRDALLRLEDSDLRLRLGRRARAFAIEHLAWSRIAAELDDFLRRVVGREAPSGRLVAARP